MSYDKYRNWPLPGRMAHPSILGMQRQSLEELVLKDLSETEDEIEKLEILDSFAAYCKRVYGQEFAESSAALAGQQLGALLAPIFLSRLPEVNPFHRARSHKVD